MEQKDVKRGPPGFVDAMLKSAQENKEVSAQTRHDHVDEQQLDKFMMNLKKGIVRK